MEGHPKLTVTAVRIKLLILIQFSSYQVYLSLQNHIILLVKDLGEAINNRRKELDKRGFSTSYHVRRGELHSPFHDTDTFPYLRNNDFLPSCYRRIRKLIKWMDDLLGAW